VQVQTQVQARAGTQTGGSSESGTGGAGASGAGGSDGSNAGQGGGTGQDGGIGKDRCDVGIYNSQNPPKTLTLSGNLSAHDPSAIEQNGGVYLYYTGARLPGKTSKDLLVWNASSSALGNSNPSWIATQVPGATNLWAPDISFYNGQYHLYYSASTFGSNSSCIGHATRESLESGSWTDHGSVVCSKSSDNWNAIDPNLVVDIEGTAWLSFGSFWSGIKLVALDQSGARANTDLFSIASRNGGAIEAPYIVRRCGYYYLFVSFDTCCRGANSTYNIRVGRSEQIKGPYVDKEGKQMMDGGGTQLVSGDNSWKGPGQSAVLFVDDRAYNIYHAYASSNGRATLRVSELVWDSDGWPISGGP
jgi:arabinan endo-1,5-alpha-L-arabinosidase